ncbi:MAG: hypothetical protein CMJ78_22740 [Planctomycetaceae bacterium]|nr:hypothetical protein [Planctomycetaceae bacterium]
MPSSNGLPPRLSIVNASATHQGEFEPLSDEQLIECIQASKSTLDRSAFEALYWRHSQLLLSFLTARTDRSLVDDIAQAVWMKVWAGIHSQFQGGSFRAWLYQIARTTMIDHHRDQQKSSEVAALADQVQEHAAPPLKRLLISEKITTLRECFSILAEREATLLQRLTPRGLRVSTVASDADGG